MGMIDQARRGIIAPARPRTTEWQEGYRTGVQDERARWQDIMARIASDFIEDDSLKSAEGGNRWRSR